MKLHGNYNRKGIMMNNFDEELKRAAETQTDLMAEEAVRIYRQSAETFDAIILAYALGYNRGQAESHRKGAK